MARVRPASRPTSRSTATASRGRTRRRARRPRDRRGRAHRHAGLRRHPHASRRAARLGSDRNLVVLARRDLGRDRELRRHLRAREARRSRLARRDDGVGRGHSGAQHPRRPALGLGELRRVPRLARADTEGRERRRARRAQRRAVLRDGRAQPRSRGDADARASWRRSSRCWTRPSRPARSASRPRARCATRCRTGATCPAPSRSARSCCAVAEALRAARPRRVRGGAALRRRGPAEPRVESELAWMREVSLRSGRPLTFNLSQTRGQGEHWRLAIERAKQANAAGAQIRPQTSPRFIGVLTGIAHRTPFDAHPAGGACASCRSRRGSQRCAIRASAQQLIAEAKGDRGGLEAFYVLNGPGGGARYDCRPENALVAVAAQRGVSPAEAFIDLALETEGAAAALAAVPEPGRGGDRRDAGRARRADGARRRRRARRPDHGRERPHLAARLLGARARPALARRCRAAAQLRHGAHLRHRRPRRAARRAPSPTST